MSRVFTKAARSRQKNAEEEEIEEMEMFGLLGTDHTLKNVARCMRMPYEETTAIERSLFYELLQSRQMTEIFLKIRNTALLVWHMNRQVECTTEDVKNRLETPFKYYAIMIQNIVHYLTRHGIINFGCYHHESHLEYQIPREHQNVLVIGAGAAGIAAATQLSDLGFRPTIFEARQRIGGRVASMWHDGALLEVGCDTLRNLDTSPINTLLCQMDIETTFYMENELIYKDGHRLSEQRKHLFKTLYQNLQGSIDHVAFEKEHRSEDNGMYVSRQQMYENMFNQIERRTLVNFHNHAKESNNLTQRMEMLSKTLETLRTAALRGEEKYKEIPKEDYIQRRSVNLKLKKAMEKFDDAIEEFDALRARLNAHNQMQPSQQYMSPDDFRDFNAHLGLEEYLTGTQLETVQFSSNTRNFLPQRPAASVKQGVGSIFEELAEKCRIPILFKHTITEIDTSGKDSVRVQFETPKGSAAMTFRYVVCTLPLGVLKKTISNDQRAPIFKPPLPPNKVDAIKCLGWGLINKITMGFPDPFWRTFRDEQTQFARIPEITERSYMLSWTSPPNSNSITTYIVAHRTVHDKSENEHVDAAIKCLKEIFPDCPDQPLFSLCTRWHNDPLAFGTGTFMSLRSEPKHFEDISEAIRTKDGLKRLFFAGEHTDATEYGTIDGAWLSGVRAAAELANDYLGSGLIDGSDVQIPLADDDFEPTADHYLPKEESFLQPPPELLIPKEEPI
ncbi:CRE-LSD-1 protein [Caenorhabditis remanei]|uniref:CRE-LSD-1 protein n=1 Tax=Caenorhabditis remanei TaxID=31234 RepID=E3MZB2_CAERE|nr:CRE-LSD-1 protein [Caenorhabditis remanei]